MAYFNIIFLNSVNRKRLIDVNALGKDEKEKELEKKRQLYNDQMHALNNFNRRKLMNDLREREEDEKLIKNIPNQIEKLYLPLNRMKDKLRNSNLLMYGHISKYNNIIGGLVDPNTFNAKNDSEYNKMIAEQRAKKRREDKTNPDITNEILQKKRELEDDIKKKEKMI